MRKFILFLLILSLLCGTAAVAHGYTSRVVDDAALLTGEQTQELAAIADQLSRKHNADIVILTVDSLGYKSAESFADDYYDDHGYGTGSDHTGILLLLSMEDRDWAISTCGDCIRIFSDRQLDQIFENIRPYLSDDDYYSAFSMYLHLVDKRFESYAEGNKVTFFDVILRFMIALAIGAAAGGISLAVMRSKMNTAKRQSGAGNYVVDGTFRLYRQQDIYLYSRTSRTRKQQSSGSSTHRSSSGRSHGGRSGKF